MVQYTCDLGGVSMTLSEIITFTLDNIVPIVLGLLILYLILRRLNKSAKMYLGMKKYVKQAIKLDRKKFNGLELVDRIKRKRKRHTNAFQFLRGSAKRDVRKYFAHKAEELPVFTRYTYGKLFKRSKHSLTLYIKQGKKTQEKWACKQGAKKFLEVTNQDHCVDELITFLHHLPDANLEKRPYDIYVAASDTNITYQIK